MYIEITVAQAEHFKYAETICRLMEKAADKRGTGIAKRAPAYVRNKMEEGKAIVALDGDTLAGFCYIESWGHDKYIANSGLIVHPDYRGQGLGKRIKENVFALSRKKYPDSKIFGITTSMAVMKINSDLGYRPVTFSELTQDEKFWKGCQSCPNYDILTNKERKDCLCTGMLFDPQQKQNNEAEQHSADKGKRWDRFKRFLKKQKQQIQQKTSQLLNFKQD